MKTNTKQGFTIIEVVLVLAIAGLIFLMVFVAFPALQRNQRDTQRRRDIALVVSEVEQYRANNSGTIPNTNTVQCSNPDAINPSSYAGGNLACGFIASYLNSIASSTNEFKSPSGKAYDLVWVKSSKRGQLFGDHSATIHIVGKSKCSGSSVVASDKNSLKEYAVYIKLESGELYCQDNSSE